MLKCIWRQRFSGPMRALVVLVLTAFLVTSIPPVPGFAQVMRHTPSTSFMLQPTTAFNPLTLTGIQLVPENPLRFDFLMDQGNSNLNSKDLREESVRLVKYFLTALTIPEKDIWVNLSPYEKDTIIPDDFIQTQMGKILLEQDYVLKQITASLTYPETSLGKQFWARVYQKAFDMYGTTDIPINTFNKVWVVPKTADVVAYKNGALIVDSQLDVMVESDYLAMENNRDRSGSGTNPGREDLHEDNQLYSNITKEIIIPELRREVNEGKYFAPLRQVYHAMILAVWYKKNLRNGLLSKIYVRQNKVDGVNVDDPSAKEKVYEQYLETFRKGIYNYIREDFDAATKQVIPRKYVSGGMEFTLLGLGGEKDRYRELPSSALPTIRPMNQPLLASADLAILTPNGDQVGLPDPVSFPQNRVNDLLAADASKDRTGSSGATVLLRKIITRTLLVTTLVVGILFPSAALGAEFSQDSQGNLIVQVEKSDTYGEIVQRMQRAYRAVDPSGYRQSNLFGFLWGPQGVVEKISEGKDVSQIKPKDIFKFEKGFLPQEVINKLAPPGIPSDRFASGGARAFDRKADVLSDDGVNQRVRDNAIVGGMEDQNNGRIQFRESFAAEIGLGTVPLDLLAGLGGLLFFLGARKVLSTGKKRSLPQQPGALQSKAPELRPKTPADFNGPIKYITAEDELPRLDDVGDAGVDKKQGSRSGFFVGEDEPLASSEENYLWQQAQAAKGTGADASRAYMKSVRALWPMDLLGSALGVILTGVTSDWNPQAVGISAIVMPFVTRFAYGVQVFLHESLGHFIPALALSPERGKVLTANNFFANFGWSQWARLTIAGFKAPSEDQTPGVDTWATGWRKKVIDVSGFVVSFGVAVLLGIESMDIWMPLLGPLGVSSLTVLAGSYSTDLKDVKSLSQTVEDDCSTSQCGIFGALWFDDSEQLYPQWVREGFTQLINALIIRGGQSAGEFTIGLKSSGEFSYDGSSGQMVPILSKVLKYKRGSGLTETLDNEFGRLVNAMQKKKVKAVQGVKGILGHVRFATGGKVTREASHPHMGPVETHEVWELVAGQWIKKAINIFAAIGHNGDNDIWKVWGLRLNTAQMREFFPALFRMEKKFKVIVNRKDPVTGKKIKEVKYEALPPGDSPPIALQMHYLLTQGDWVASARVAYVEQVINHDVEKEFANADLSDKEMAALIDLKLQKALEVLLTQQEEDELGATFQGIFLKHMDSILRPRLRKADKSFKDLWVTPAMIAAQPALEYQLDALNDFRNDLKNTLMQSLREHSQVGRALQKVGVLNEAIISHFVDVAVEKFFTGNRAAAVQEFARRSEGTYGVALRTSKELDGVTIYSNDQGVTIGYNQESKLVTFSSEHSTLQYAFGAKGKMDALVFVNPEQPGQMADVNLSNDRQAANPITIKVYSFARKRTMTPDEIAEQQFPQGPDNRYWSQQISYKDPNNIVLTDVQSIPKEVLAARQSWEDPDSFNRQTAEPMLEKMTSRYLELYIKSNSEFYGTAQGNLAARLFSKSTECLAGAGCTAREANRRSAQLSNRLLADGRVLDYLKGRLDWVVGRLADELALEMISGKLDETDLVVRLRQDFDERLKILLDKEVTEIVDAVIMGNLNALQSWKDWEQGERITKEAEMESAVQEDQQVEPSSGMFRQGLKAIADLVAGFMSPKSIVADKSKGRSLDSGETDMFIAGYEDSLWLGENFVDMMKSIFPKMNIWATSANKVFNLNGEHRVGRRTLSMIVSKSGATFPSRGIVRRLKQISPGNIFAMTARVDTLIAMALGQKFQPDSPFIKRIFVTGNYYPAEANSVGEVMLFAHQIELVLYLAERMQALFPEQRPWGMNLNSEDIVRLKALRDKMYDESRRITGRDQKGNPIDGRYLQQAMVDKLKGGYLRPRIEEFLINEHSNELKDSPKSLTLNDVISVIGQVVNYSGPDVDPDIQATLKDLWGGIKRIDDREAFVLSLLADSKIDVEKIDEAKIRTILISLLERVGSGNLKKVERTYLSKFNNIVDNAHALGKTMTETGIVTNIVFRIFVMSIFWFGAPLENIFSFAGIKFGPTLNDLGGMIVRTLDGLLTLFAPWLITTMAYRIWSGRPQWSRLGPPTVALGDTVPALHQTAESFWSKLGAVALGSMTMNIHGANPDDHFVARLAHRVVRGTIAIFGVPVDPSSKDNVIVTMKQTKAIINGMFLNFFKGGAEVFSVGRGELNNPDVTDHHMDIGEQNLEGASKTVRQFNNYAFDAFGRHIAYKVLFAYTYDWATRWEPRISIFGRTFSLRKLLVWNPAWSYSRTAVHTTRSPKGGSTDALPVYLDPGQDGGLDRFGAGSSNLPNGWNKGGNGLLVISREGADGDIQVSKPVLPATDAPAEHRRGGIDLNSKWLDLRVTSNDEVTLFLGDQNIESIPIRGIMPRILEIRPVNMDQIFLLMENSSAPDPVQFISRGPINLYRFKGGLYNASVC